MFKNLANFGFQRSKKEAVGFYIVYFVIIIIIAAMLSGAAALLFGMVGVKKGIGMGAIIAFIPEPRNLT